MKKHEDSGGQCPPYKENTESEFDVEQMRYYMSISVEEKLKHLEQLNQFTQAFMPESSKRIWEQLQKEGF